MSEAEYRAEQIAAVAREMARLDLVNVVRCRDCRFSLAHGNGCGRNQDIYDAEPDGFCKWGEKRGE